MRYKILKLLANLIFWPSTLVFFTFWLSLCAIVWLIALPFDYERRAFRVTLHTWCWLYMKLCPFWRYTIEGRENLPQGACVYVANHQSLMDISVLLGLNKRFKWVAKKELFSRPFVGWLLFFGRDIKLDRASLRDASRMIASCLHWLQRGVGIMIFPEGHRSSTVGRFKRGAFQVAQEAQVPIVPIAVSGPAQAIKGYFVEPNRTPIRIQILSPIFPEQLQNQPLDDVAREVEEQIRSVHKENHPELYTTSKDTTP